MTTTVLLAGATGYMGSRLARELVEHGYHVLCPVRDPGATAVRSLTATLEHPSRLELIATDLSDRRGLEQALKLRTVDAVVSCVASRQGGIRDSERVEYGINSNLLHWAGSGGAARFVLLSAICVQKPRLAFQFAKLRFEEELAASGMDHAIVRPTAFFKSLSGQLARVRRGKPFLIFGDGTLTRCKPIAEADLARYLRETLEEQRRGVLPVGGPGPAITPLDQARMLEALLETPVATRRVNPGLLLAASRLLQVPGTVIPAVADKAEFARIGHYYATESMLLWDPQKQRYDADATPEYGSITLQDSYRAQLAGTERQLAGSHAMFD